MSKEKEKPIQGIVFEALPSTTFKVKISDSPAGGEEVLAYLSGKMRLHHIKVLPGDRVLVELSEDGKRGRIIRRL
ncbi:MAG: translation initiation factor IF-1 [Patescibacteria group bacterium]